MGQVGDPCKMVPLSITPYHPSSSTMKHEPLPPLNREFDYHRIAGGDEAYRENYDRIFRKDDPIQSLVPGTIRNQLSDCCGKITRSDICTTTLTKVNVSG